METTTQEYNPDIKAMEWQQQRDNGLTHSIGGVMPSYDLAISNIVRLITKAKLDSKALAAELTSLKHCSSIIGFELEWFNNLVIENLDRQLSLSEAQRIARFFRVAKHGFKLIPSYITSLPEAQPRLRAIYL